MPNTKDTFNSIASVYDKINNIISLGRHKNWKSFFISNANFEGKILDIATGTGDIISSIKKIYPNTNCYGIDPSKNMLYIAKQKNNRKDILRNFINCNFILFNIWGALCTPFHNMCVIYLRFFLVI